MIRIDPDHPPDVVYGVGKKGCWSVVNGLTDLDVGHQCNEEWQKRLVKVKQENVVTGTAVFLICAVRAFPLG